VRTVGGSRSVSAAANFPTTTVRSRHRSTVGDLSVSRSGLRPTTARAVEVTAALTPTIADAIIIGVEEHRLSPGKSAAANCSPHETQLKRIDRTREVKPKSVANKTIVTSGDRGVPSRSIRRARAPSTLQLPTSPSVSADQTEFDYRLSSWSRQTTSNSPKFENRDIGHSL
jgi:hypothetical protein